MAVPDNFTRIVAAVDRYVAAGSTESQGLLNWFLFNVFRLDEIQAQDSICDKPNDKGIDGLWVDDDTDEIIIFQSKYTKDRTLTLGDKDLKAFVGASTWFSTAENIERLLNSGANAELKALIARYSLAERVQQSDVLRLVFVTLRALDDNAKEYLEALAARTDLRLEMWDQHRLTGYEGSLARKTRVAGSHVFDIGEQSISSDLGGSARSLVASIKAKDLASMQGIADRSLFALNVRLPLGRTRVNRELEDAIRQTDRHKEFVLYHNGVTVICRTMHPEGKTLTISDYSVVNGCQSAIAFHNNRTLLTDDLRLLAKFIEVGDDDALAEDITYSTNNQNGINLRDLKSNDRIQIALKNEFDHLYGTEVTYLIKAGEDPNKPELSNDRAGQFFLSLYLDEPYRAHQKYRLFGSEYERVFGRHTTAPKLYLGYLLHKAIEGASEGISDKPIKAYQLTKFVLLGIIGRVLRDDEKGRALLDDPTPFLPKHRTAIIDSVGALAKQIVAEFDFYIKEKKTVTDYFDYKAEFKSPTNYKTLALEIQKNYARSLVRHPEDAFKNLLAQKTM